MPVRIYVNWLDDKRGMRWSVDNGTQASERVVRGVRVVGWMVGRARVNMKAKRSKGEPNAWIEFEGASFDVYRGRAFVRPW